MVRGSPRPWSGSRLLAGALTAVLVGPLGLAGPFAGPALAAPPSMFTTGFTGGSYQQPAIANLWLDRTVATGARVVLIAADWAGISPSPPASGSDASDPANPAYHWGGLDDAVREATAHGLTVAFTIAGGGGGPAWADGPGRPSRAAPGTWRPSASAFGRFAAAVARRYSGSYNPGTGTLPHVRYYQAWGEPNLANHLTPQWVRVNGHWAAESPIVYRGLLNAFYTAVKAVNRSNVVITAGTAPFGDAPGGERISPALFVRRLLCLKGQKLALAPCPNPAHFDILAHHPYSLGAPSLAAFGSDDVSLPDFAKLTRPLAVAERTGRALPRGHKRVWVTEFSWETRPPDPRGVPVMERAYWTEEAFYLLWQQGVDTIIWFNIQDQAPIPDYASTYQPGWYYLDGKRKPGIEGFRFPFVVEPSGRGSAVVWGITPDSGTVLVQRLEAGRWKTILTFRKPAHAIFTRTIAASHGRMRARVGNEVSLIWP